MGRAGSGIGVVVPVSSSLLCTSRTATYDRVTGARHLYGSLIERAPRTASSVCRIVQSLATETEQAESMVYLCRAVTVGSWRGSTRDRQMRGRIVAIAVTIFEYGVISRRIW